MRQQIITACAAAMVLSACSGGGGGGGNADGPAAIMVQSGDNQNTNALRDSLGAPVGARLVRLPASPTLAARMGQLLVRPAYAQTSVKGIPGQTVCAVPMPDSAGTPGSGLIPWNPCTTTGPEGNALFYFNPPTKSGRQCAEIRAVVDGLPVTPDTACADVSPGPYAGGYTAGGAFQQTIPRVLPANLIRDVHGNAIPYRIVPAAGDTLISIAEGAAIGSEAARSIIWSKDKAAAACCAAFSGTAKIETASGVVAGLRYEIHSAPGALGYQLVAAP